MFLYEVKKENQQAVSMFKKEPYMTRVSHSYNDPNWTYPYHVHTEETELIYFSQGKAQYQINHEIYHVQKGDLLIVNKGCIHSITSSNEDPISCWTCGIQGFEFERQQQNDIFLPLHKCPHMKANRHEDLIAKLFEELSLLSSMQTLETTLLCNSLTHALAALYLHIYQDASTAFSTKKATFVQDVLFYINENYAKPITLAQLSTLFHISADHISHKFKEIYGLSPINYVIERRISEAKWMLINTQSSLVSISQKVGYENTTHFSNLFYHRVGYPPLTYRELFGSGKYSGDEPVKEK